jgi:hypothetical protein
MLISQNTLMILKSFTSINPSIYIKEGNIIRTISPQKTVIAIAEVDENFETAFGIYDLNQFLSAISIFDKPDFTFKQNFVTIKNDSSSVRYGFADEKMIMQAPDKTLQLPDVVVNFVLTEEIVKKTMQAASILDLPNWTVTGDGSDINIVVGNVKDKSSNVFKYKVGETDKEFELIFKVENLRFMPEEYNVQISSKGISHFITTNGKLQYFIATESV